MRILNDQQDKLLQEERIILNKLRVALVRLGASSDDQEALDQSIQQLDEFFLLVVVGEFNSGKSAFINALLGTSILKEGVTPTTTQVNILRFGETKDRQILDDSIHIITAPVTLLSEISIVDTPGTNAIIREHEEITSRFIPRSDLVLFITSADRPFTESERAFLEKIRDWGKKVVIVINKIDILQNDADLSQIETFILDNARKLLGITPEVFPVSARNAFQAKSGQPERWTESRFETLEQYIHDTLDETSRLKLKFLNPLGVGMHITDRYLNIMNERLALLSDDFEMLDDVNNQLAVYQEDMTRDFNFRMSDIENILLEMEQRGQTYFDKTMRLVRVFDLLKKDRIQSEFKSQVVADVPEQIERKVDKLIDWLVDSDLRQWQAVTDYIADRRRKYKERIIGELGFGSFHYDRERLIEGIGRESKKVIETYDKNHEARQIAEGAHNAVAAAAAIEVSAVGLGALVAAIATTVAADVTGILLASVVAALGFFIIPARRRQAKKEMHSKIAEMRAHLVEALEGHFQHEIERSLQHINETISPYTRFVRAERTKNLDARSSLVEIKTELNSLQTRINEFSEAT
jgi:small GTP-binding protein